MLLVLLVSLACFYTVEFIGYRVVALVLLMTVSFLAMLFEIWPVLIAAVLSSVIWNFFFIPPLFTFHIDHTEDVLMFLMYFFIAMVNAVLTSRIRREESRARDKEEKEKTIKLYNTLLNSLSHELRTPVSTILGAVDTLKESKDRLSTSARSDLLSEIDKASIRLNRQVENLLNMSRLESGMLKPKPDWCDLAELINGVIQKINPGISHTIRFNPAEDLPLFRTDAGLMEQIVYNLMQNAIQYTPDGSVISISVKHHLSSCVIVVADNGPGFPAEAIPKVFDKFYRLPSAKAGGSGLGLSIVKGFTEALKGTVLLENGTDGGACFTLVIPAETTYLNNLKNE
ncbi:MAG: DUF4118 domain-containing protein [Bacteroidia bacterium]|nr:DUF4118 domain-containing protein [Bacteroidia bacterium]